MRRQPRVLRCVSCHLPSNADTLVGENPQDRDESAWRQAYRALEHGYVRRRCHQVLRSGRFSSPVQRLAAIAEADDHITAFRATPARERRAFAVYILMRERQD